MRAFLPKLEARLSSFGPDHLPILTKAQVAYSLKLAEKLAASRGGLKNPKRRRAAVLVPLCTVDSVPSVMFTLRSEDVTTHKSEISFPGGHRDCGTDASSIDTALRETKEELASPDGWYDYDEGISILGKTGKVPSLTGIMVTPVVGAFNRDLPSSSEEFVRLFPGNEGEVDSVFTVSVRKLLENETSEPLPRLGGARGKEAMGPVFPTANGKVWGLTAIVLRPILHEILKPAGFYDGGSVPGRASRRGDEDEIATNRGRLSML